MVKDEMKRRFGGGLYHNREGVELGVVVTRKQVQAVEFEQQAANRVRLGGRVDMVLNEPLPENKGQRIAIAREKTKNSMVRLEVGKGNTTMELAVAEDVLQEKMSVEHARDEYGVVVSPDSLTIDTAATDTLRASKRSNGA